MYLSDFDKCKQIENVGKINVARAVLSMMLPDIMIEGRVSRREQQPCIIPRKKDDFNDDLNK